MDTNEMLTLSQEFADLGALLRGDGDHLAALHRMVELVVKHVPGCNWASITVMSGSRGKTLAASDPVAEQADRLQYELGEGPCLQAAEDDRNFLLFDVESERRWPRFAQALADQTPVRSVLSFQLAAEESAALNVFADRAGAFTGDAVDVAGIIAAHASSLVALHETGDLAVNLKAALDSSRTIGAAIGVLMAYHRVTQDEAFDLLRVASQHLHRKLRDVAVEVTETGVLPELSA